MEDEGCWGGFGEAVMEGKGLVRESWRDQLVGTCKLRRRTNRVLRVDTPFLSHRDWTFATSSSVGESPNSLEG